jgi:hypothetical protein
LGCLTPEWVERTCAAAPLAEVLQPFLFFHMSVWEYKVITSGKGGFATPALLESFLNQLGKDEWEIIDFRAQPDNALAFTGLARRSTQRDWTLEGAAASAARAEADKLRAEFEAKFKGVAASGAASEEKVDSPAAEKADSDDGLRRLRDTESDQDPDAPEEEGEPDEWEKLAKEDELPTFFESLQPLMRRNQRGSGLSVGVDYAAKKWGLSEDDVLGALKECGFVIPDDEDAKPTYIEYDGDLYWVNVNRRGELWINTKEKPRRIFRVVQGTKVEDPTPAQDGGGQPASQESAALQTTPGGAAEPAEPLEERDRERDRGRGREGEGNASEDRSSSRHTGQQSHGPLPDGQTLLSKIRPLMRRNRGAPGWSGSAGFLSRALKCREADLIAAFEGLGLTLPSASGEPSVQVDIGSQSWWLNKDQRGGIWINGREKKKSGEANPHATQAPSEGGQDAHASTGESAAQGGDTSFLTSEAAAAPEASAGASPETGTVTDPAAVSVPSVSAEHAASQGGGPSTEHWSLNEPTSSIRPASAATEGSSPAYGAPEISAAPSDSESSAAPAAEKAEAGAEPPLLKEPKRKRPRRTTTAEDEPPALQSQP